MLRQIYALISRPVGLAGGVGLHGRRPRVPSKNSSSTKTSPHLAILSGHGQCAVRLTRVSRSTLPALMLVQAPNEGSSPKEWGQLASLRRPHSRILVGACDFICARTPAEIRRWLMYNAFDCSQEYPIDAAEIRALLEHKPPTTKAGKCFIACVFKKLKWMNEKGEFDVDKHYAFVDEEAADNPAFKETGRKLAATCKIVNDEPVSDGTIGCDRAANLAKCFIENSAKV
ncbi:hypothetical protein ACJJTC_009474 [Scirpophaga incertulas]